MKVKNCLGKIMNLFKQAKYDELVITKKAYLKLMCYVNLVDELEITGLGRIKNKEIIDFKIPVQEVTGTTADATDESIINLLRELPIEEIEEWELDWHSHASMKTFISSTDEANYELMMMGRGYNQFPIMVVNKKSEFTLTNFMGEGKTQDIKLKIKDEEDLSQKEIKEIYEKCKKEIEEKVNIKTIKITNKFNKKSVSFNNNYLNKFNTKSKPKCEVCGVELITQEEINNGVCEDCSWNYRYYM